jgi:hypothetical protein
MKKKKIVLTTILLSFCCSLGTFQIISGHQNVGIPLIVGGVGIAALMVIHSMATPEIFYTASIIFAGLGLITLGIVLMLNPSFVKEASRPFTSSDAEGIRFWGLCISIAGICVCLVSKKLADIIDFFFY